MPVEDQPISGKVFVPQRTLRLFIVAGEHSGDALGARLMHEINRRLKGSVRYLGVGGEAMEREGLSSQFPLEDVAVMGPLSILPRLPKITRRVYQTVDAAVAADPDLVLIIDSPEFTHPIAKRVRRRRPEIPIIDYVSPSVWAWRPGRARKMAPYVDHLLALLPFEPGAHERLGGPPCTYVGHPLVERRDWLDSLDEHELAGRLGIDEDPARPVLVVLPGSRRSEVERLMEPFGQTITALIGKGLSPQVIIPAVSHLREEIGARSANWSIRPHLVEGEADKFRAFKLASAALAASGTVTLELAMSGTPMVVGYKVDPLASRLRFLVKVPSIILANLVLDDVAFPEFIQEDCTAANLASALADLMTDTGARARQLEALAAVPERMAPPGGLAPSQVAADIVLRMAEEGRPAG